MSDIDFTYPENEPSIICTRSFDAPLGLVWKVFTEPVHIMRWWGPQSLAPIKAVEELDLRKGGRWRFVCRSVADGTDIVFYGQYIDVVERALVSNSFGVLGQFPDDLDHPETHSFSERDGRTYYRSYTLLPDFEAREAVVATGMEVGGRETMEQLGDLVSTLIAEQGE